MLRNIFSLNNYYLNPFAIPYIMVSLVTMWEGIFIYFQNKKSPVNLAYMFSCLSASLWQIGLSAIYMSKIEEISLFWAKGVSFLGIIFVTPSVYFLSAGWQEQLALKKRVVILNYVIASTLYIFCLNSNLFIDGLWRYPWGFYPKAGPIYFILLLWFYILAVSSIKNFIEVYYREKIAIKRKSARMMGWAFSIAFIGSLEFLPNYGFKVYLFAFLPLFIGVTIVGYGIIRYKLMDIETAFHKTAAWFFTNLLLIIPFVVVFYVLRPWYLNATKFSSFLFLLSFLLSFLYFFRVLHPKMDRLFQRERFNLEEIANRFIDDLVHLKGFDNLIQRIEKTIGETLYPQHINIYIFNDKTQSYKLMEKLRKAKKAEDLNGNNAFLLWLMGNDKIVYRDFVEIDPLYTSIRQEAKDYFNSLDTILVIPLVLNDRLLGVINLGKKANFKRYTAADFHFLTILKNQATIAISNSLLYENIEEQVRQRTKELVEVQKQLIQAEKLATVGTLAGGVAHEINNPLTAILTNVQMLLAEDKIDAELDRESLELIEEATKRCRTIVQKLMTYAKKPLETAKISEVNLLDVLKSVFSFLGYQLEQDNIKIIIAAKEGNYLVLGNHNELEQVVTNLVINAKDAIKQIKKGGDIHISLEESGDWIKMKVKDEGMGISKEVIPKIFDPFFTTKEVGKGVGLGLSICQAIVEKHNGLITAQSELGKGSVFSVQLPKAKTGIKAKLTT